MLNKAESLSVETPQEIYDALVEEAMAIDNEDKQLCLGMGTHGAPLTTEKGIVTAPYKENLLKFFPEHQSI